MTTLNRAKRALWTRVQKPITEHGYFHEPEDNIVEGVDAKSIKNVFQKAGGHEWERKFRAVHSSAALAANTFGKVIRDPYNVKIADFSKFESINLEKKCPTGLGGTPPHLDVFLQSSNTIVGIESKLLEPITPKKQFFSSSYCRDKLPQCENVWWNMLEKTRNSGPRHFDAAQMIKHYLGLRNSPHSMNHTIVLIYLYWKPINSDEIQEYTSHLREVEEFMEGIKNSEVKFIHLDYLTLWDQWERIPELSDHTLLLKSRYCVVI